MANKKKTGARPETSERRLKLERAEQRDAEGYSHEHQHWSFEPEFVLHPGDDGLPADADENPTAGSLESICGGVDDSQDVEQYNGTLGVSQQFVNDHERPVGQLQWNSNLAAIYNNPGNVSGKRWCSGTLIANDLFLTAGHCFDQTGGGWQRPRVNGTMNIISSAEIAGNMHVNFNYQFDPNGNLRPAQSFPITALVEYRLGNLDFAVCRLQGNPGAVFGTTQISTVDANATDMLCIIQHPAGVPKRIEAGPLLHLHDDRVGYASIDTLGGTSGAGVLGPNGTLVGVHTNGGCSPNAIGHNHGFRITSIINASPTVRRLSRPAPPPPVDDCERFVPLLLQVLRIARSNRQLRRCLCYYVCRRGRRPGCSQAVLRIVRITLSVLRRCPQYRRPFCRALRC